MASISKRASGAWQNTSYGIRGTATDTITTLPTTIYSDGTNATVSIKGNTTQSGTPTPDSPVMPQGCGELDSGQYKIPISSADTTTPIYLGEVETTRKIRKLVFDGTENFALASADANRTVYQMPLRGCRGNYGFCTHIFWKSSYESSEYNRLVWTTTSGGTLFISLSNDYLESQTAAAFKSYLSAQYAAGTPVTVWYVLAEPETGIVNEPLMKIEDYADVVNNISIPTTDGANVLSVDTTVQPSEVSVNYHGWHMGTVHERTARQWD